MARDPDRLWPDVVLNFRVIWALIIREMATRYGRTWGGYAWAIIEPVGMIAILSLAFSQFIRTPPLGDSFVLFYATGYIPFHFFMEASTNTSGAVTLNRQLMQLPMVTPLDAVIARFILSMLTLVSVSVIVFIGMHFLIGEPRYVSLDAIVLSFGLGALVGLGIGTMNALIFPLIPVWRQIWGIISRPLFLISGIFFLVEEMPESLQNIVLWNPLVHVVGVARSGFFPTYDADYVVVLYPLLMGLGLFVIGAALLVRNRSQVVEVR